MKAQAAGNMQMWPNPKISRGRRWDHLELLERIDVSGSISAAASAMGMSYKAAWEAVEAINNLSDQPLVERKTGGVKGGGTTLTSQGRRVVGAYRRLEQEREQVLKQLAQVMGDFEEYYHLIRRFDMKTSARNQYLASVKSIKLGAINAEVTIGYWRWGHDSGCDYQRECGSSEACGRY